MLIGLGGHAGAGKDVVADHLVASKGYIKMFFSRGVNEALLALDPWLTYDRSMWTVWQGGDRARYSEVFAWCGGYPHYDRFKKHPEVRRLLQAMGTEVGRTMFGSDVWVEIVGAEVAALPVGADVVVTGVRHPNEMAWLIKAGGMPIWVERPGFGPVNSHSSDNAMTSDGFPCVLPNIGSLDELRLFTDHLLPRLIREHSDSRPAHQGALMTPAQAHQGAPMNPIIKAATVCLDNVLAATNIAASTITKGQDIIALALGELFPSYRP